VQLGELAAMMGLNVLVGIAAERSMESFLRVLLGYTPLG
jgi:hypothetical protein